MNVACPPRACGNHEGRVNESGSADAKTGTRHRAMLAARRSVASTLSGFFCISSCADFRTMAVCATRVTAGRTLLHRERWDELTLNVGENARSGYWKSD